MVHDCVCVCVCCVCVQGNNTTHIMSAELYDDYQHVEYRLRPRTPSCALSSVIPGEICSHFVFAVGVSVLFHVLFHVLCCLMYHLCVQLSYCCAYSADSSIVLFCSVWMCHCIPVLLICKMFNKRMQYFQYSLLLCC